jgi:hypothetical protein
MPGQRQKAQELVGAAPLAAELQCQTRSGTDANVTALATLHLWHQRDSAAGIDSFGTQRSVANGPRVAPSLTAQRATLPIAARNPEAQSGTGQPGIPKVVATAL